MEDELRMEWNNVIMGWLLSLIIITVAWIGLFSTMLIFEHIRNLWFA